MPLNLHVGKKGRKFNVSESAKKHVLTDKLRHVRRCRLITSDSLLPARAHTHVPPRVINKTLLAYVATPT